MYALYFRLQIVPSEQIYARLPSDWEPWRERAKCRG